MIPAENAIRARRRLTNKLIAEHASARLRPFFDPAATVIAGNGAMMQGADAILDAFAAQFAEAGFISYARETETIEIDDAGERAAERGRWTGRWRRTHGEQALTGVYLAVWKKVTGQWVIESELYVTLGPAARGRAGL